MELLKCGSTYTIKELGEGPKYRNRKNGFVTKRIKCIDQVRLKSPPLPLSVEAHWERRKLAYARECCFTYRETTGSQFLKRINLLIAELGVHYDGCLAVKEQISPQDKKYLKEHQKKFDNKRAFEDFAIGLQAWVPKSMTCLPTG